ncbi:MAG: hypothetical protein AAGF46_05930, partial [Pseudomonadota bacterium]
MTDTIAALEGAKNGDPAVLAESIELLQWLANDRFTFLGYREYKLDETVSPPALKPVPRSGLGVNAGGRRRGHANPMSPAMQRYR